MGKKDKRITEYIAAAPAWARPILKDLRKAILSGAPEADESISYHMPYYSHNGRVGYFSASKNHCSFHWVTAQDKKMFSKEMAGHVIVGSTLRIPRGAKVPTGLIKKIVQSRVIANNDKKIRKVTLLKNNVIIKI